jgi:hypothetical protein
MEATLLFAVLLWSFNWRIKTQNADNRRKRAKRLENRRKIRREAFLAERRRR